MPKSQVIDISTARAPAGLSAEGRKLWRDIISDYSIDDAAGLAILQQLCEALDRLRECQVQIKTDGLTVAGYNGQTRPHPLLKTEAEFRRQILSCFRALALDPNATEVPR